MCLGYHSHRLGTRVRERNRERGGASFPWGKSDFSPCTVTKYRKCKVTARESEGHPHFVK